MLFLALIQILSGLGVAFSQPAFSFSLGLFASIFGYAIHWKSLDGCSDKQAKRISFIWFFAIQGIQLFWMTSISYQGCWFLLVYLFVCAALAWQFSFFTGRVRQGSLSWKSICSLCGLWVLLEWIRLQFFCGFAFNFVGISLADNIYSLQLASICGVLGLSFWVMLTNLLALKAFRGGSFFFWALACVIPYVYGVGHLAYHEFKKREEGTYGALLVQTGLLPSQKYRIAGRLEDFVEAKEQWRFILREIALHKSKKLDLLVLPEAAVPFSLNLPIYHKQLVESDFLEFFGEEVRDFFPEEESLLVSNQYYLETLSRFLGAEVVTGLDFSEGEKNYNSVFCFSSKSCFPERYDKQILLPLVEYLPFRWLEKLSASYGIQDFFTKGEGPKLLGSHAISSSICYEELFPSTIRQGKLLGARLFVNVTNDAWYPESSLSEQHFTQGLIRAVENGVPLLRSSNTGVTAAVDSEGRVIARLGNAKTSQTISGSLVVSLSRYHHQTLFSLLGEGPFLCSCFLFMPFSLRSRKKRILIASCDPLKT